MRPSGGGTTRDEALDGYCSREPTDPARLEWELAPVSLRLTLRLRMRITRETISDELAAGLMAGRYPDGDPPEVQGLLRILDGTCDKLGLPVRLEAGPRERRPAGDFEPYWIRLPFARATLSLYLVRGEFQWVLRDPGGEPPPRATALRPFMEMILSGTREWVRNGNR